MIAHRGRRCHKVVNTVRRLVTPVGIGHYAAWRGPVHRS
jgi:hypothetical protein